MQRSVPATLLLANATLLQLAATLQHRIATLPRLEPTLPKLPATLPRSKATRLRRPERCPEMPQRFRKAREPPIALQPRCSHIPCNAGKIRGRRQEVSAPSPECIRRYTVGWRPRPGVWVRSQPSISSSRRTRKRDARSSSSPDPPAPRTRLRLRRLRSCRRRGLGLRFTRAGHAPHQVQQLDPSLVARLDRFQNSAQLLVEPAPPRLVLAPRHALLQLRCSLLQREAGCNATGVHWAHSVVVRVSAVLPSGVFEAKRATRPNTGRAEGEITAE